MDEQIIPCFNAGKPPAGPSAANPTLHDGGLRKTRSVTYGMSGMDQAMPGALFLPMHVQHAAFSTTAPAHTVPTAHAPSSYMGMPMGMHLPHMAVAVPGIPVGAPMMGSVMPPSKPCSDDLSPSCLPPPAQKPRWETPLRVGKWPEEWESATELAEKAPASPTEQREIARTVRSTIAEALILFVGEQLPRTTVDKWLCLLAEYLELNADEQVLVLCLLRRYVDCGGLFVGEGDNLRPHTWERVVAVCCYLAVLLSEEFPGRAASDLRELLGPNFKFGADQISFLKKVDWRISVSHDVYMETKRAVAKKDCDTLLGWFKSAKSATLRKNRAEAAAKEAKRAIDILSATEKAKKITSSDVVVSKKRVLADMSRTDDGVVPGTTGTRINVALDVAPYWSY